MRAGPSCYRYSCPVVVAGAALRRHPSLHQQKTNQLPRRRRLSFCYFLCTWWMNSTVRPHYFLVSSASLLRTKTTTLESVVVMWKFNVASLHGPSLESSSYCLKHIAAHRLWFGPALHLFTKNNSVCFVFNRYTIYVICRRECASPLRSWKYISVAHSTSLRKQHPTTVNTYPLLYTITTRYDGNTNQTNRCKNKYLFSSLLACSSVCIRVPS